MLAVIFILCCMLESIHVLNAMQHNGTESAEQSVDNQALLSSAAYILITRLSRACSIDGKIEQRIKVQPSIAAMCACAYDYNSAALTTALDNMRFELKFRRLSEIDSTVMQELCSLIAEHHSASCDYDQRMTHVKNLAAVTIFTTVAITMFLLYHQPSRDYLKRVFEKPKKLFKLLWGYVPGHERVEICTESFYLWMSSTLIALEQQVIAHPKRALLMAGLGGMTLVGVMGACIKNS